MFSSVWLIAVLLLSGAILPVSANRELPPLMSQDTLRAIGEIEPFSSGPRYQEVIRAIEAYPDVVVFPLKSSGPLLASSSPGSPIKLADNSKAGGIAVIYPDIGEPYRSVFTQIIGGIEEKAKGLVSNYPVGPNANPKALNETLRQQNTKVVIALGRQGMKVASELDGNLGIVVGGVLTASDSEARNLRVNSLSPDPALLFSRLKELMPRAKRIYTVYDPAKSAWIMRLAKDAARSQGLELVAFEATDLKSAMQSYQKIFAVADTSCDALWLPQDSTTVEDSTVLPTVLQQSWGRNLAVFSSTFDHVRRGVLFSLYPNNVDLGKYLAGSALGFMASGGESNGIQPLREVLMAINLRTAKHLGLDASRQLGYAMAFPEQ